DSNGRLRAWEALTGREVAAPAGVTRAGSVTFSADGRRRATGHENGRISVWDVRTGRELVRLPGTWGVVGGVAFSPDGNRLASCNMGIKVWDVETGTEVLTVAPLLNCDVAFSPDGRYLVAIATLSATRRISIWDASERPRRQDTGPPTD